MSAFSGLRSTRGRAEGFASEPVTPGAFRESVRIASRTFIARARELVGERNPREHDSLCSSRSFDAAKSAAQTGVPV